MRYRRSLLANYLILLAAAAVAIWHFGSAWWHASLPWRGLRHSSFESSVCAVISSDNIAGLFRGRVDERHLRQLHLLVAEVKASGQANLIQQHRNFGEQTGRASGHEVTYLHQHVSERVLHWLWQCAVDTAATTPEMDLSGGFATRGTVLERPALRCLEAIEYFPHGSAGAARGATRFGPSSPSRADADARDLASSLGWHHDGASLCTMAVALSSAGEHYEGGELQFRQRRGDGPEALQTVGDFQCGDVAVWRGWDLHRVCPLQCGRRLVLVAEWWLGEECSGRDPRPPDVESCVRETLREHPRVAQLHVLLGQMLAEKGEAACAASSCRVAIGLDPRHVEAHHGLGTILAATGDLEGAEVALRRTLALDPQQPKVMFNLARCLVERGDAAGAARCLRAALRLDPSAPALHQALARVEDMLASRRQRSGEPLVGQPPGTPSPARLPGDPLAERPPARPLRGQPPGKPLAEPLPTRPLPGQPPGTPLPWQPPGKPLPGQPPGMPLRRAPFLGGDH